MALTYGFFNSIDGDRTYNADQMSQYFKGLVSSGVYESVGGALQVIAGNGMTVNVQTGRAIVYQKWMESDAVETIAISAAHAILNRYTAVVVRLKSHFHSVYTSLNWYYSDFRNSSLCLSEKSPSH